MTGLKLSQKVATQVWLLVLVLVGLVTTYEEAAVHHLWGLHTISYWSARKRWLAYLILAILISLVIWWWHHFHQNIPW